MKTICFYFQIHQPFRFRRYRFFDIGVNHYYYDDYSNESIIRKLANKSFLPANKIILDLIKEYGTRFKVAFSISGTALDQFEIYAPDVLESFQKLAKTGCVEFLAETYAHSLAALKNKDEFTVQVKAHSEKIFNLFGLKPKVFRNTELIYNNDIGNWVEEMGFKTVIAEGAKHILGWKSPNYLYCNATNPRLKLLLRNYKLSDDISLRFSNHNWSEYPLNTEKYVEWINAMDSKEETLNLFMSYETFGGFHAPETGIFEFLKALPKTVFTKSKMTFSTPSEISAKYQAVAPINFLHPVSWTDEARDVSSWTGNELQQEALNKLYALRDNLLKCNDPALQKDWYYLQVSDHFNYMSSKFFTDGLIAKYNSFSSPYDAFINYMNILSDFEIRIKNKIAQESAIIYVEPIKVTKMEKKKVKKVVVAKAAAKKAKKTATKKVATKKAATKKKVADRKSVV